MLTDRKQETKLLTETANYILPQLLLHYYSFSRFLILSLASLLVPFQSRYLSCVEFCTQAAETFFTFKTRLKTELFTASYDT